MKNKSNVWLIVVVIIVLVALVWPVLRGKDKSSVLKTDEAVSEETSLEENVSATNGSLKDSSATTLPSTTINSGQVSTINSSAPVASVAASLMPLKVYFGYQASNPSTWTCSTVSPVTRFVPRTQAVARVALTELLKGPQASDLPRGGFTSISEGVGIKQLTIVNGLAHVDFDHNLVALTGDATCVRDGVRAQITQTLKQFSTVKTVLITVNGIVF